MRKLKESSGYVSKTSLKRCLDQLTQTSKQTGYKECTHKHWLQNQRCSKAFRWFWLTHRMWITMPPWNANHTLTSLPRRMNEANFLEKRCCSVQNCGHLTSSRPPCRRAISSVFFLLWLILQIRWCAHTSHTPSCFCGNGCHLPSPPLRSQSQADFMTCSFHGQLALEPRAVTTACEFAR